MIQNDLAFIFPGQGSQTEGMLSDVKDHPVVAATLAEANEALGFDLSTIILEGSKEELSKTVITQPAILTVSIALWRLWCESTEIRPQFLAGHSLGEYSAMVAAGVLSFKDAVQLVSKRASYMQEAVQPGEGAMAAILGMDDAAVVALCEEAARGDVLSAVNFNSPGQVVIAGTAAAVERASVLAKEKGARKAMPLPVSVPSHCMLMKPAADRLAVDMAALTFNAPSIAVLHNVDVQSHTEAQTIKTCLIEQLYQPVRWTETIEAMAKAGVTRLVECGPGKVLTGLNKRIDKGLTSYNIDSEATLNEVVENFASN
ncbi:ACP S-malonyltransferase [Wohlfahrtiimonas chitiniclastica]|uniref:ACP S-malonyltransferase n=1 Tax=Wohlfahrtiimonas chitiniclastica TaxID=400946 RepID=UPI000B97FC53|nr:ACP S-malonyltransferase [Wohlfahrtiimonas chitiniclastica]OYQ74071.1 [acyl-carrier-protein] S-malonyltransferase [Wohlfahrtiimonas chitiniclastica]